MGNVLIRDFPPALKAEISQAANTNGRSISDEVIHRLMVSNERAGNKPAKTGADLFNELRAAFDGVFETNEEHDAFHRELEQARKNDYGKPPQFG